MASLVSRQLASRLAGLELNALVAAGTLPAALFEGARVSASSTLVYDLNGEVLFHRVPVRAKESTGIFADIAASPVFGDTFLRVSHGLVWDEKALIATAEAAAKKQQRGLRYDSARFVAYSYPKVAVQFLAGSEEVVMIELGSWKPVPPARKQARKYDEPPGNFERWSLIEEYPPNKAEAGERRIVEKIRQWEEIAPAGKRGFDARVISRDVFVKAFESIFALRVDTRQVAYGPRAGDHVPCYELQGQETNVWCVAGSVQMILDFYRYNYDQTRIAADLGLGTLANPNGLPYANDSLVVTVLEALTSNALDANMTTSPSWTEFRNEIRANRPLISFIPGHSRTVAGYTSTRIFLWYTFRGLLVYDPWPPTTGVITQWENFDASTYRRTFTAAVKLV